MSQVIQNEPALTFSDAIAIRNARNVEQLVQITLLSPPKSNVAFNIDGMWVRHLVIENPYPVTPGYIGTINSYVIECLEKIGLVPKSNLAGTEDELNRAKLDMADLIDFFRNETVRDMIARVTDTGLLMKVRIRNTDTCPFQAVLHEILEQYKYTDSDNVTFTRPLRLNVSLTPKALESGYCILNSAGVSEEKVIKTLNSTYHTNDDALAVGMSRFLTKRDGFDIVHKDERFKEAGAQLLYDFYNELTEHVAAALEHFSGSGNEYSTSGALVAFSAEFEE